MTLKKSEEMFQVQEQNGLRLITPSIMGGVSNAPWTKQTIWNRSRLETVDGTPVSVGFPKFFNLGQGPLDLQVGFFDVVEAAKRGDAVATLKVDGSLLIRSVHEGKVMWRTRGAFDVTACENAFELEEFKAVYPKLFEPTFSHCSLLFEWCSPNNQIVIKYSQPSLVLIGAVIHNVDPFWMRLVDMEHLKLLASDLGVPLVEHFPLTEEGWDKLHTSLETNTEIEGYVIRLNKCQTLVKVKTPSYLTKHALRSRLTTESLADLYFQWGCPSFEEYCSKFKDAFDEECCMWALGAISGLFDGVREFNAILFHMKKKVEERKGWTRKDAAIAGQSEYGGTKRFSLYMELWLGKEPALELQKTLLLQCSKQVELSMFKRGEE